jgi:hypothetical protein
MDRRTFLGKTLATVAVARRYTAGSLPALAATAHGSGILQAKGREIVEGDRPVRLRGVNLGGWLEIEDYMIGLPWTEWKMREQFKAVLGEEKYNAFFDAFDESYIAEVDIAFLAKQGFNFVRFPFSYRCLEDDMAPGVWLEKGFRQLDRVIELCRRYKIWVMLDLHATAGAQARDQNAGSAYGETYLWNHREFLDRTVALWGEIARRYSGDPIIAGYNPVGEPVAKDVGQLNRLYLDIIRAIRKWDTDHMIMLDPNLWAKDIASLHDELFVDPQVIPAIHHYFEDDAVFGSLTSYPAVVDGKTIDRAALEQALAWKHDEKRIQRPVLLAEFGLLRRGNQPFPVEIRITRDLLSIAEDHGWSWALWCYKDLKEMGIVTPRENTPWRQFLNSPELTSFMANYTALEEPFVRNVEKILSATDIEKDTRVQWAGEVARDFDVPHLDFVLRRLASHSPAELAAMARSFSFASCEVHEDQLALLKEFLPARG